MYVQGSNSQNPTFPPRLIDKHVNERSMLPVKNCVGSIEPQLIANIFLLILPSKIKIKRLH